MENKEESLRLSAQDIPCIDAPWLTNALQQPVVYRSDTIKTLKTTGPPPKQKQQQQLKRKNQEDQEATSKKIKV